MRAHRGKRALISPEMQSLFLPFSFMATFRALVIFLILFFLFGNIQARDVGPCGAVEMVGQSCHAQGEHWQHDGVCASSNNRLRCHVPDTRNFSFHIRVRLIQSPLVTNRISSKLWIRGSGPGLTWDTPIKLKKSTSGIGIWTTKIKYTYDSQGILCQNSLKCSFNQRAIELRVYQDQEGNEGMIGPNLYINLPVSGSILNSDYIGIPDIDIFPWFHGTEILLDKLSVSTPQLGLIQVTLLYPPSYDNNIKKTYPVMVLFGANVAIQVAPLLEYMFTAEASIKEVLVVVLHHNDSAPFCTFNPYSEGKNLKNANLIWRCKTNEDCSTCHHCWDPDFPENCTRESFLSTANKCLYPTKCAKEIVGEAWLDAIENQVMPKVTTLTKGRARTNFPINRLTIMGFDGIGLLACHAAITRSHIYQNAACFSPPLHWPLRSLTNPPKTNKTGIKMAMKRFSRNYMFYPELFAFHNTQKYYMDYGEFDNKHLPFIDHRAYMDKFIEELHQMFDVPSESVLLFKNLPYASNNYIQQPDGGTEVLNRIKTPLTFFFGVEGNRDINFIDLSKFYNELTHEHHHKGEEEEEEHRKEETKKDEHEEEEEEEIPSDCNIELQMTYRRIQLQEDRVPIVMLVIIISRLHFYTVTSIGLTIYFR